MKNIYNEKKNLVLYQCFDKRELNAAGFLGCSTIHPTKFRSWY